MDPIGRALAAYGREVAALAASPGSTEATFYPAIQRLLAALLEARGLPFEVRVNTSQRRAAGGTDLPDLALYDGGGDFVVVYGEVKTPTVELSALAVSTAGDDQIGRYLARAGVVLLSNVRGFALVTAEGDAEAAVPPERRRLLDAVELWPSASSLALGRPRDVESAVDLADLVETAVTEFAPIAEPESLARVLARQARRAKGGLPERFSQAVQPLLDDFASALGLTFEGAEGEEFLRSSLIQTAFYGLFASWTLWHAGDGAGGRRPFRWQDLGDYLKIPFLGALFHEFRHPARLRELGLAPHLDRAAATLARVDEERFFARFALPGVTAEPDAAALDVGSPAAHAILYFYEPFLEAFDPELRKELGVWYTPPEIVRYQVRRVDRLLRDELGCERGFADPRVVVLDPCCGTGAYLLEVLRAVAEQLAREGAGAALAPRLLDAVCHRIVGFEILTAPFVVAQLQLYGFLAARGVEPDEGRRPAIFLTNALTGWDGPEQLKLAFPELQQEHDAAQRVKREAKIIVVLGNPPYNRFAGAPVAEEQELADHYKGLRRDDRGRQVGQTELFRRFGIRKHLLDDLYLRFFRLAEIRIGEEAEYGVVSFISNSSYLAGRSHPLMRESLLGNFHTIWIDNLHGNRLASERTPWGESCETIFNVAGGGPGIKMGTAIATLLKMPEVRTKPAQTQVFSRDFWGRAHLKRGALLTSLSLEELPDEERERLAATPEGPRAYEEVATSEAGRWKLVPSATAGGYEEWPALDDLFPNLFQGVNPNRGLEGSVVATSREELAARMREYFSDLSFDALRRRWPELVRERARYDPVAVRERLFKTGFRSEQIVPYLLFPLDLRFIYYETEAKFLNERRPELWDNLSENCFLVGVPQSRRVSESRPLLASCLFDLHLHDRGSAAFPLHVRPAPPPRDLFSPAEEEDGGPVANLHPAAWSALAAAWHLSGDLAGPDARQLVLDLFHVALAVGHAPQFQLDHQDALAHDWLHLPIPRDRALFLEIADLGARVAALLDPLADASSVLAELLGDDRGTLAVPSARESDVLRDSDFAVTIAYFGSARGGWEPRAAREAEASHPAWGEGTGDLWLNDTAFLAHVPERVWRYELGGYPVVKKWLGYRDARRRPGRPLTLDELDHLRGIVHRLAALLVLQERLDGAYERAIEDAFTGDELAG